VEKMRINVDQCGMEIVNGNHHKMKIIANNTNGNRQVCGMKINMGNEK
jgi:hypothetical protein